MKRDDFSYTRAEHRKHLALQVLLAVLLFLALNGWAILHSQRWDLTQGRKHTLSTETQDYLKQLTEPVEIFVTFAPGQDHRLLAQAHKDIKKLLDQYAHATWNRESQRPYVRSEFVNIFSQKKRASWLAQQYDLKKENTILVVSGKRYKEVALAELYEIKQNRLLTYKAEAVLTSTLRQVSEQKPTTIYYTHGHGELDPESTHPMQGCSQMAQALRMQYCKLAVLDLNLINAIPRDADAIMILGPRQNFLPHEVQTLRRYLNEQQGAVMLLVGPLENSAGLAPILQDWGLALEDTIAIEVGAEFQAATGDCIVKRFGQHPITQPLIEYDTGMLLGLMRPIQEDKAPSLHFSCHDVQITPLLLTSPSSWAKDIARAKSKIQIDPEQDTQGPLAVGVLAEQLVDAPAFINIRTPRLLVVGNSDFVCNHKLNALGNTLFLTHALRYLTQNTTAVPIASRPIERFKLILQQDEIMKLSLRFGLVPLAVALMGAGYCGYRKKKYG